MKYEVKTLYYKPAEQTPEGMNHGNCEDESSEAVYVVDARDEQEAHTRADQYMLEVLGIERDNPESPLHTIAPVPARRLTAQSGCSIIYTDFY
jgi:hypothetical protein